MNSTYIITAEELKIEDIAQIMQDQQTLGLDDEVKEKIVHCRKYLENKIKDSKALYYGINTGFGALCNKVISNEDLNQLQKNLVMSHACGMGDEVSPEIVKMMLLLKIKGLSLGHSGVTLELVERLIYMFNNNILPVVYKQGSLGASGDLAPLAHLSLPLIHEGYVDYNGERRRSSDVFNELSIPVFELQAKEGLALLNGTQFMSAHAVHGIIRSMNANHWACLLYTSDAADE